MWGRKERSIAALRALLDATVLQRDDALSDLDAERDAHRATAQRLEEAQDEAQARRVAQDALGRTIADQRRQLDVQQRQLDAATGLDDPRIEDGATWQERRADKAQPHPGAGSPSGRLPGPRRSADNEEGAA